MIHTKKANINNLIDQLTSENQSVFLSAVETLIFTQNIIETSIKTDAASIHTNKKQRKNR